MNFKALVLVALSILVTACSPKLNSKDYEAPVIDLRPEMQTEYDFTKLYQQAEQFEVYWDGEVPTAEVHDVIQSLMDLSEMYENPKLKNVAASLYKKYYAEAVGMRVSFFRTPYYELFQNEALPSVRDAIDATRKRLDKDLQRVFAQLNVLKNQYPWPQKTTYRESIAVIVGFLDAFSTVVKKMKLYKEFEEVLLKEVKDEKNLNIRYLEKQLVKIESQKTLANMLDVLDSMVKEFEIPLDAETIKQLESGQRLSVIIEKVQDEKTAFEAIVAVWLMLDSKDRQVYFTPISSALYNFMSGQKDADLLCLAQQTCPKFFASIVRDFAILPQLKKFGVDKIKITLNEKTHGFVLAILEDRLHDVVINLDTRIVKKITRNMAKAKDRLASVRRNASGFTKEKFLAWLKPNLALKDDLTLGYEFPVVMLETQKKQVKITVPKQPQNIVATRTIGTSLASNAKIFGSTILAQKQLRRAIIEQVNRVMGFGGLPLGKTTTVGLTRSFQSFSEPFDIGKAIDSTLSFGLPDRMTLAGPFMKTQVPDQFNVSAEAQVDLGNGLLETMNYLKDWQANSFDNLLGKYKATDIFGSDSGGDNSLLFSKTDFFGMVTAQFLNWIINLTKEYSQVGLVTDAHEVVWLKDYGKDSNKTLLYGVYVDIVNGQRADEVHLEPMVKLLRLLRSVRDVVDGIENTQFSELRKKDLTNPECRDSESPKCPSLAQVISLRVDEVKQIMLPIGNTIATKFRKQRNTGKPGQGWGRIQLSSMTAIEKDPVLKDQLLIIESLIYVYEATKIETYLWAAKETYAFIQKYYNPKTNFFEMETKVASIPMLVQMLRTFKVLTPYLDEAEHAVLTEKLKIWEFALENVR
ncbi:MAG: hypothetical protein JNL11_20600 [Bdellovibrionaceae bacterium]|nr:hypothetical protein [Pseudobdellovibrionaceae bacterium]